MSPNNLSIPSSVLPLDKYIYPHKDLKQWLVPVTSNKSLLLDQGADVNAQGREYSNALQAASNRSHKRVIQMLLDQGGDVNVRE